MAKNLALKNNGDAKNTLRLEKAAEHVSNDLDKVIHERMRLGIISALAANEKMSFGDLKKLLDTTDGKLERTREEARRGGLRRLQKSFAGRTPADGDTRSHPRGEKRLSGIWIIWKLDQGDEKGVAKSQ
jgi:hypothetical protein